MNMCNIGACLICSLLIGCGGGGGGSRATATTPTMPTTPNAPPFGMTQRPSLAAFNLPTGTGTLGTYALQESFPSIAFSSGIFVAGVPGENRLVVVEQSGAVRVFVNDPASSSSSMVLDLSARVLFGGEQGLLGLAFDPDFAQNRYLYVHYSMSGPRRSVIARFSWDELSDTASVSSEKIILEIDQPFGNHNGGMLAFGPDDYLYIAMGDGGSGGDPQNHAQDPSDLLGSMLRIDVHPANAADAYDVPPDNPFLGQAGFRAETYAFGLRNPFRFSFDRQTGDLWLGDVGQSTVEEIDLIEAGGNYGWRVFEGTRPFDDSANTRPLSAFTDPVLEYGRGEGVSVIGGYVYRGSRIPSLQGRYLYTDWTAGSVWALRYENGAVVSNDVIFTTSGSSTSFGEGNDGEVYLLVGNSIRHFVETSPGSGGEQPPALLSDTGVFSSLSALQPAQGFVEYDVNHSFWSDGTIKRRWIAVPDSARLVFDATGAWDFPLGTVLVKHFELELIEGDPGSSRRLETRLLIHAQTGWQGFTYRWNAGGTDADLLSGREQEVITVQLAEGASEDHLYEYPSRTDCTICHTQAAGRVLGVRTRQINRDFAYAAATDNQLRSWNNVGYFSTDITTADQYERYPALGDGGASLSSRSRAYLDINCAQCHQPGGGTPGDLDLRYDTALAAAGAVDALPQAGDLGITDARIIAPGDRSRSVLLARMQSMDDARMPPLGSHRVDDEAVSVIGDWIDTL